MNLFLLLLLCLFSLLDAKPLQERSLDPTALSELTLKMGIAPEDDLIAKTQELWRRKPGKERWEINEISPELKAFVIEWTEQQGLLSDWLPSCQEYDMALILGSSTRMMQKRIDYLAALWNQGIRFKQIVWLLGDRPLDNRVDQYTDRCATESEAAHIIWYESDLPEEMRQLPLRFVEVPMQGTKRPTTADTIDEWLNPFPGPCSALFVSDQPFCGYQYAVINSLLPDEIDFDVVGQGTDPTSHPAAAAIILDCIASWIYQEGIDHGSSR